MEADRKIDLAVALQVVGWQNLQMGQDGEYYGTPPGAALTGQLYAVPYFTTQVFAGLSVATHMQSQHWQVLIRADPGPGANWRAAFDRPGTSGGASESDNLLLAICMAALEAVARRSS